MVPVPNFPSRALSTVDEAAEVWYAKARPGHRSILFDRHWTKGGTISRASANDYRVNQAIRAPRVRLIGPNGENWGIVSREEALRKARELDLDLVEVAPNANPPVCRILDFGKFLYQQKRGSRGQSRSKTEVKELRLRPRTSEHDRNIKIRKAREWLEDGKKVRIRVQFRGREITYPELVLEDLKKIAEQLQDIAKVEAPPKLEGRAMIMMLVPLSQRKRGRKGPPEPEPTRV